MYIIIVCIGKCNIIGKRRDGSNIGDNAFFVVICFFFFILYYKYVSILLLNTRIRLNKIILFKDLNLHVQRMLRTVDVTTIIRFPVFLSVCMTDSRLYYNISLSY